MTGKRKENKSCGTINLFSGIFVVVSARWRWISGVGVDRVVVFVHRICI